MGGTHVRQENLSQQLVASYKLRLRTKWPVSGLVAQPAPQRFFAGEQHRGKAHMLRHQPHYQPREVLPIAQTLQNGLRHFGTLRFVAGVAGLAVGLDDAHVGEALAQIVQHQGPANGQLTRTAIDG